MSGNSGQFVWSDLVTSDVEKAKPFYREVVGWKVKSEANYEMWTAGDEGVGGIMSLASDARQAGAAPHWLAYVETDNVDATIETAKKLGGRIIVPGTDIPNIGRYAVLSDPQNASFAVFQSSMNMEGAGPNNMAPGHFIWAELNTTDWKSAWKFYSGLFSWQHAGSMDMGPQYGEYFMFGLDSKNPIGGMSNAATMMKSRAHWLQYVNVKNADETVQKINAKGGKVLHGPMDVPDGRIAQCMDPQGAVFAIYSPAQQH